MLSFIATGTPARTPMSVALRIRACICSASATLAFSSECRKMLSSSGPAPISVARLNEARTMSAGDVLPARTLDAIRAAPSSV